MGLGERFLLWTSLGNESDEWAIAGSFDWFNNSDDVVYDAWESSYGLSVRCIKSTGKPFSSFSVNPSIGTTTTNFQFDASGCSDAETPLEELEFRWDWNGDSVWDTHHDTVKIKTFRYTEPGSYLVKLQVFDKQGSVDMKSQYVTVADGIYTDSRDDHEYLYKAIGDQTWMLENLAYLPSVNPYNEASLFVPCYYVRDYNGSNASEAKATDNYSTYGVLYNWSAAMQGETSSNTVPSGVQGICPDGWHLPSDEEWTILTDYLANNGYGYGGSGNDIGKSMASTSGWIDFWYPGCVGNDQIINNSSGFNALPGGGRYSGGFVSLGKIVYYWSSSEHMTSSVWYWYLSHKGIHLSRNYSSERSLGFSVRCIKDEE